MKSLHLMYYHSHLCFQNTSIQSFIPPHPLNYNLNQEDTYLYSGIFIRGPTLEPASPDPSLAASLSLA